MSNEVNGLVRIIIFDSLEEDLSTVDGRGGSGYACDEDIDAMMFKNRCYSAPVRYLEWCDGWANCD